MNRVYEMNCAAVHVLLLPAVQGRVRGELAEDLQNHLHACASCRTAYSELQELIDLVEAALADQPPAPDTLWNQIQGAMQADDEASTVDLVASLLRLLNALGVPEWATDPLLGGLGLALRAKPAQLQAKLLGTVAQDLLW